jgi:hypothetical protein
MSLMPVSFIMSMADSQSYVDHAQNHKDKRLYHRYQSSQHVKGNRYHKFRQTNEGTNDFVISHHIAKETQRERDRPKSVREQFYD